MKNKIISALMAAVFLLSCTPLDSSSVSAEGKQPKLIALTFDDGPNTTTTNDVLDILEEYNAKASFFLIGDNINEESASSVKRAHDMGMEIDNHSKTHSNMSKMQAEEVKAEITYVDEKVKEITGEYPKFFRPPFIDVSQSLYDAVDLPFICGIDCQDYMPNVTAQERADYILNGAKDGVIVLLHDAAGNQATVDALKIAMPELVEQDYEFVTLTELFERQGETPKHNILYSNVGKHPTGYREIQELSSDSTDRITLDPALLDSLGNSYAVEMEYSSSSGYPPVIALQKWSGTPQIWHAVQPFYFNGDKALFVAEDVVTALEQLKIGYSDLDGIAVTAYSGEVELSNAKLLTKAETADVIKGDVNADGSFNITDVVLFQKWLLAKPDAELADWKAADFCNDERLNVFDLCLMKRALFAEKTGDLKTQTIPVSESNAKLIGRTQKTDGITWLVHSGSAAEFTINGTEASVTICGDSGINSDEKYRPRYGVYVDGKLVKDVVMGEKEQTVMLFSGTASRTAAVKIIHLSEANNGCIGVKDLTVTSSSSTPVKPTPKKELMIEFIGDSITCAYGVEAGSQYESFSTATENFTLSYAYLTAQLLDADYSAVCYSGHGIVSGYTNDGTKNTDSLVPPYYEMVGKPKDYQTQWDFSKNPADVIVLNLGTNDDSYASKELETRGAEYQELYEDFLKQIRKCNPDANIICTLGIMGATELYPYIEAAVNEVGDPKITCYESPVQDMNDLGADWHPSSKAHEKNAYLLADKISTVLGKPSDKIGIDLAADSKLESEIDTESGANAWPYYAEWNRSMNVNISAAGNSPESITVYIPDLVLPTGKYELSFKAEGLKGEMPYEVRSMKDPKTVYASGTTDSETTLETFDLNEPTEDAEIVFMIGEQTGSITFSEVTLYKMANL